MRIGQAAAKYGVSIDTLNYYVQYGLLVPPRKGGQRDFDEATQRDLELVLELKDLEFSLGEIHRILSLYRVSGLTDPQDVMDLRAMYGKKRAECVARREHLIGVEERLEAKLAALRPPEPEPPTGAGLPVGFLELLCCPACGGELEITGASMSRGQLHSGQMACPCGYRAEIEDGILITPNRSTDAYDKPDINRDMYKNLPPRLISLFQHAYNWMVEQIGELDFGGKVVMETYINAWFFLHNHQRHLHPAGRYIVVDKYPETLRMYKGLIDRQKFDLDILYIADAGTSLPLRPGVVDVHLDFFALNEHNFYHNTFLLDELAPYLKAGAHALGTYFYFEDAPLSMERLLREYPTCSRQNFSWRHAAGAMAAGGFTLLDREPCGVTTESGDNIGFGFHADGERMGLMSYLARRDG